MIILCSKFINMDSDYFLKIQPWSKLYGELGTVQKVPSIDAGTKRNVPERMKVK